MKFKAISVGKEKGDLVELSAAEKAVAAVSGGAGSLSNFDGCHVFASGVEITNIEETKNGDPLKKRWENNVYVAEGKAAYHLRRMASDTVLAPKEMTFNIKFKDTLDSNGLPDIKILDYTLS